MGETGRLRKCPLWRRRESNPRVVPGVNDGRRLSWLDHDLDRLPLVHRPVPVRDLVEADDAVEDAAWFDPAVEDVREKLLDVGACRSRPAADGDVAEERRS